MDKFKLSKNDWLTFPVFLGLVSVVSIPFVVSCVYLGILLAYKLFG